MKPEDLGKTFLFNGQPYTLTGMRSKAAKYPMTATNRNGKTYCLRLEDVKRGLGYKVTDADIAMGHSDMDDWRAEMRAEARMS